jgi:hypothetical protein
MDDASARTTASTSIKFQKERKYVLECFDRRNRLTILPEAAQNKLVY